ncbi:MAG: hypothetical protein HYU58_02840 [Proteobacteria bacterium]|nr:hypothetical protein [Pseudomonadota bacterium]
MTWLVHKNFTYDETYHPDFSKVESPPEWQTHFWHRMPFDARAGEIVAHLADELNPLPDFLKANRRPLVSGRVRALIEASEPSVHQFLPCKVFDRLNSPVPKPFWGLNVLISIEAVVAEKSNVDIQYAPPEYQARTGASRYLRMKGEPRLVVDAAKVAGRHLWVSREFPGHYFVSDALMASFEATGVFKVDALRVSEI